MIAKINGTVTKIFDASIVLETNGIGYEILMTEQDLTQLNQGQSLSLWTYLDVAETHLRLYGFKEISYRSVFKLLVSISGVGPKMALGILSVANPNQIRQAVQKSNPALFKSVSGIGQKNANRIVLELQSKLDQVDETFSQRLNIKKTQDEEIYSALTNLGYSKQEINSALQKIDPDLSTDEKIKQILKNIG